MRELRTVERNIVVEIEVYSECKYEAAKLGHMDVFENSIKVDYSIESWEIITGEDAVEIESMTDDDGIDDHHEYLVLHLTDGNTATFRNSYVDMFRVA